MSTEITYKLIAPTIGTNEEWLARNDDFILPEGVLGTVLNRQFDGQVEFIVGDGTTKYSELSKIGVTLPTENAVDGALLTIGSDNKLAFVSEISSDIINGIIAEENLPKSCITTLKVVETQDDRLALTTEDVQNGDFIKQNDTGVLYFVVDDTQLNTETGYEQLTSNGSSSMDTISWDNITDKPTTLAGYGITDSMTTEEIDNKLSSKADSVHTHTKADISDFPTKLSEFENDIVVGETGTVTWDTIQDKPETFTPSEHTHTVEQITDFPTDLVHTDDLETLATKEELSSKADSVHTHTKADISDFPTDLVYTNDLETLATKEELSGKADSVHTHTKADISDFPTKLSEFENDIVVGETGTVTWDTIQDKPETFTPSEHTHTVEQITDFPTDLVHTDDLDDYAQKTDIPTSLPNPNALTIKYNNVQAFSYDGSSPETGNFAVTLQNVPVAVTDDGSPTTNASLPANSMVKINAAGTMLTVATAGTDYVEPSGNVESANKLQTARSIGISGVGSTPQEFDGTSNISIPITAVPYSIITDAPTKLSEFENDIVVGETGTVTWDTIQDKPETFTPSEHTHTKADISDFPTDLVYTNDLETLATKEELSGKADSVHTHTKADISDFPTKLSEFENDIVVGETGTVTWDTIQDKPDDLVYQSDIENMVSYSDYEGRKIIQLANYDAISGVTTGGAGVNIAMVSQWDKVDLGSSQVTMNLNTSDNVTINDDKVIATTEDVSNSISELSTSVDTKLENKADSVHTHTKADISDFPTKLSEFENDAEYLTEHQDISNLATKTEVSNLLIYNMGDFDTLDAASERASNGGVYDNLNYRILLFTVNGQSSGLIINNVDYYKTEQYLYYDMHRYTRRFTRNGDIVSSAGWQFDDYVTYAGKGVVSSKLFNLTTDSTSDSIKEAFTKSNGDGVLTKADIDICLEKGMMLKDETTGGSVVVGYVSDGPHYTFTLVGLPTETLNPLNVSLTEPQIMSIIIDITSDDVFSVYQNPTKGKILTEDYEKLPVAANIRVVYNSSDSVYSESTILGWFDCTTLDELKSKIKNSDMLYMVYANSETKAYRMPIHFIELRNSDTQLYMVTSALDMTDDSPCRYEITANLDGTIITSSTNVEVVKTHLATEEDFSSLDERLTALEEQSIVSFNFPIDTLEDIVYDKNTILGWFGISDIVELENIISTNKLVVMKYTTINNEDIINYNMPVQHLSFSNTNQIEAVIVGLNINNDAVAKYEITMNLDETILESNSNIKVVITSLENRQLFEVNSIEPESTSVLWLDTSDGKIKYHDGSDWQTFEITTTVSE